MIDFISEVIWYFNKPSILTIHISRPKLPFKRPFYYCSVQVASSVRPAQPLKVTHLVPLLAIIIILPKNLNCLLMSLRIQSAHLQDSERAPDVKTQ